MLVSFIAAGKNWSESGRRVSVRRWSVAVVSCRLPVSVASRRRKLGFFDRSRARYRGFAVAGPADKKRSLIEHDNEDEYDND
jgi:hypothetical protein